MQTLPLLLALFLAAGVHAEKSRTEVYSDRPDIRNVSPKEQRGLISSWARLKSAHTETLAQMLELYPDHEIYFLGRDAEYLHDLGMVMTDGDAKANRRIHLLNVSRINLEAKDLDKYLDQEGISAQQLRAGKKVLFVDTGFSGSIPMGIKAGLPEDVRKNVDTHLIVSTNPVFPSSRTFLSSINPESNNASPTMMQGTLLGYEGMPRYTHRSSHFVKKNNRWEPASTDDVDEGTVSPKEGLKYMQDLKAYGQRADTRAQLKKSRERWRRLKNMYETQNLQALEEELKYNLDYHDPVREGQVRDFLEWVFLAKGERLNFDLGLTQHEWWGQKAQWPELAAKHPEWNALLTKPEIHIPKLLDKNDVGTLGSLTDILQDDEFFEILVKELGKRKPTDQLQGLMMQLIKIGDTSTLVKMANDVFTKPAWNTQEKLVDVFLQRAYQKAQMGGAYELYPAMAGNLGFGKTKRLKKMYADFLNIHLRNHSIHKGPIWALDESSFFAMLEAYGFARAGESLVFDFGQRYADWTPRQRKALLDAMFADTAPQNAGWAIRYIPKKFWKANPRELKRLHDFIDAIDHDEIRAEYKRQAKDYLGEGGTRAGCKRWMANMAPEKKPAKKATK